MAQSNDDKAFIEIRKAMKQGKFPKEHIDRTIRLLKLKPTAEERQKWILAGILTEDGRIIIGKDEMEHFDTIVIALWNMAYEGLIERAQQQRGRS